MLESVLCVGVACARKLCGGEGLDLPIFRLTGTVHLEDTPPPSHNSHPYREYSPRGMAQNEDGV
jgi:hypothetical protein